MMAELGGRTVEISIVVWNGKHLGFLALSSGNFSKTFFFKIVLPYLPFLSVCDSLLLYLIAVFFHPHLTLLMLLS